MKNKIKALAAEFEMNLIRDEFTGTVLCLQLDTEFIEVELEELIRELETLNNGNLFADRYDRFDGSGDWIGSTYRIFTPFNWFDEYGWIDGDNTLKEIESNLFGNGCHIDYEINTKTGMTRKITTVNGEQLLLNYRRNQHNVYVIDSINRYHY